MGLKNRLYKSLSDLKSAGYSYLPSLYSREGETKTVYEQYKELSKKFVKRENI